MRHSLPLFGATAAVVPIPLERLNVPLGAMIEPMHVIGLTVNLTKVNQAPGLNAHHFETLLLGLGLGSRVTSDIFEQVKLWPFSLTILIVTIVVFLWLDGTLNQRLLALGFMPSAFQVMLVITLDVGADDLYVTTHDLIRVLAMGTLIPFFASYWSRP